MDVAQITEWSKEDGVFVSWWTCEAKKDLTDEVREARDLGCVKLAERTGMNACARVSAVFFDFLSFLLLSLIAVFLPLLQCLVVRYCSRGQSVSRFLVFVLSRSRPTDTSHDFRTSTARPETTQVNVLQVKLVLETGSTRLDVVSEFSFHHPNEASPGTHLSLRPFISRLQVSRKLGGIFSSIPGLSTRSRCSISKSVSVRRSSQFHHFFLLFVEHGSLCFLPA